MSTVAEVRLWGRRIGAVALADQERVAAFEYAPAFLTSGVQPAPLTMPLSDRVYRFPELADEAFHGLPGMLADSLPDKFGNRLIDAWLARQGRSPGSMNAVERLCYIGNRGMGALEFRPRIGPEARGGRRLHLDALVELASEILNQRQQLQVAFSEETDERAMAELLRVGTSAGGARAKALIAWNPQTNEVRSGQVDVEAGFEHWLLKFDGVRGNRDRELDDPAGYGLIEYAYWLMARAAGIEMSEARLLEENGRCHFMTRRFDRTAEGGKLHMQSLGAIAHLDYNQPGAHGYEQAMQVMRRLGLDLAQIEQFFTRAVFNILARNQDDHVKNIAFLMDQQGQWRLSPAFDVVYSYNPDGAWTARHQMSLNGKQSDFRFEDFQALARVAGLKRGRDRKLFEQVRQAVLAWPEFAGQAGVPGATARAIGRTLRANGMDSR
jgi:serine/threonine-protein kinase HipA